MKTSLCFKDKRPVLDSGDVVVVNKRGSIKEYQIIYLGHGEYGAVGLDLMRLYTKAGRKDKLLELIVTARQDSHLVEIIKSKDLELRRIDS